LESMASTTADEILRSTKARLDNKVAIVTGASAGIGIDTARVLALGGAKVFLACRDKKKTLKVIDELTLSLQKTKKKMRQKKLEAFTS